MLDGPLPTRPRQLAVITVAAAGALVSLLSYTTLSSLTLTYGRFRYVKNTRGSCCLFVCPFSRDLTEKTVLVYC